PSINILQTKTFLEMPYKMVNISYKYVYTFLNQQKEYAKANRLLKKTIQLGLNIEPLAIQELTNFMKNFITKHTPNQKSPPKNPKTLLAKSYNILSSSDESDGFDSFDSNYDNNELDSQDIENINLSLIQNSIVHTKKAGYEKWYQKNQILYSF
ncbi:14599_t:CDS:2, partial [Racocetra persica]